MNVPYHHSHSSLPPFSSHPFPSYPSLKTAVVTFLRLPGTGAESDWLLVTPRGRWPCWISASNRSVGEEEKRKCS